MGIVDETGKPVAPANDEPKPEPEEPKLPEVVIRMKADGDLSIEGPNDIRVTLAMLDEAKNLVGARLASNLVLAQLARAQQGVSKPGLRDVLAFSKVPRT